jgi:hypothetical protein
LRHFDGVNLVSGQQSVELVLGVQRDDDALLRMACPGRDVAGNEQFRQQISRNTAMALIGRQHHTSEKALRQPDFDRALSFRRGLTYNANGIYLRWLTLGDLPPMLLPFNRKLLPVLMELIPYPPIELAGTWQSYDATRACFRVK